MSDEAHKNYLQDLGPLLIHRARLARDGAASAEHPDERHFAIGVMHGYYEVISLLQSQAAAFQIPLDELGLSGFDPDVELTRVP